MIISDETCKMFHTHAQSADLYTCLRVMCVLWQRVEMGDACACAPVCAMLCVEEGVELCCDRSCWVLINVLYKRDYCPTV